jgi:hypothetical protein
MLVVTSARVYLAYEYHSLIGGLQRSIGDWLGPLEINIAYLSNTTFLAKQICQFNLNRSLNPQ